MANYTKKISELVWVKLHTLLETIPPTLQRPNNNSKILE